MVLSASCRSPKVQQPVARNSLAAVWTGKGWVVWKNRLGIPDSLDNSSSAADIKRLQTFLIKDKKLRGKADGIIGKATATLCGSYRERPGFRQTALPMRGRFCFLTAAMQLRLHHASIRQTGKINEFNTESTQKTGSRESAYRRSGRDKRLP